MYYGWKTVITFLDEFENIAVLFHLNLKVILSEIQLSIRLHKLYRNFILLMIILLYKVGMAIFT